MENFNTEKILNQILTTKPELTIILPCRNEEKALPSVLTQIKQTLKNNNIKAEIIVSDSSTDNSPEIAKQHNVTLIKHDKEGYGNAYLETFKHIKTPYIFLADCDGTYDFNEIPKFLNALKQGYDFVIGNRFKGKIDKNAMPWSHQHIGNPILSGILRLFFKAKIKDSHSGMRAIKTESLKKLNLQTTGMEFASEMVIKALKNKLKIKQIPINYHKRIGKSKLKSFPDAWRHMRFMLLYSPLFLFFIPGLILFLLGTITMLWIYFGTAKVFGITLHTHPLFLSSLFIITGYQLIIFSMFAKIYAINHLNENSPLKKIFNYITIENSIITGGLILLTGAIIYIYVLIKWINANFSSLDQIKNLIIGSTLLIIGIQTIFSSFMISILGIKEK